MFGVGWGFPAHVITSDRVSSACRREALAWLGGNLDCQFSNIGACLPVGRVAGASSELGALPLLIRSSYTICKTQ